MGLEEDDVWQVERLRQETLNQFRGLARLIGQAETERQGEIKEIEERFSKEIEEIKAELQQIEAEKNSTGDVTGLELLVIDYDRTTKILRYSKDGGANWTEIEEAAES